MSMAQQVHSAVVSTVHKMADTMQPSSAYEQEDKENVSQNTACYEADRIAANAFKEPCPFDNIPTPTRAVARLPSSGTPDELEKIEATPPLLPRCGTPDELEKIEATPAIAPPEESLSTASTYGEEALSTARSETAAAANEAQGGEKTAEGGEKTAEGFSFEQTKFIFDWDDTLLPSTWVSRQGLTLDDSTWVNDWQRQELDKVAKSVAETLLLAKEHGEVIFVTNAEHGWVPLSCQKFMPSLYPLLEDVRVVSARTTYESASCKSLLEWKLRCFDDEIARLYGIEALNDPAMRKNVIGVGDSVYEREALLRSTADLPSCSAKSLKFVERPDLAQLLKQHSLVINCFNQIVNHDGNLDLLIKCN